MPIRSAVGAVVIPKPEQPPASDDGADEQPKADSPVPDESVHTEIHWILLKLGSDMGLEVWVARNVRSRTLRGQRFADIPRIRRELLRQFDEANNRLVNRGS